MSDVTWFTAVHEAAHIVVALHCGVPVTGATNLPKDDYLGVTMTGMPNMGTVGGIQKELAISYAGGVATSLLFSEDWGTYGDLRNIEDALEGMPVELNAHYKQMAFDIAKAVVRDRREDILWFADHLYKRRWLNEAQIEQLWNVRKQSSFSVRLQSTEVWRTAVRLTRRRLAALRIKDKMQYRIDGTTTPLTIETHILEVVRNCPGITTAKLIGKFDFSLFPNFSTMFFLNVAKKAGRLKEANGRWYLN